MHPLVCILILNWEATKLFFGHWLFFLQKKREKRIAIASFPHSDRPKLQHII